jgi:hypothetical protein
MTTKRSQSDGAALVTIEDATNPTCGCGHAREDHGTGGCYSFQGGLYCVCTLAVAEVDLGNIERIVRREVAAELDRAAAGLAENVDWSDGRNNYGDNEGYEIAARTLRERAEEIRNG